MYKEKSSQSGCIKENMPHRREWVAKSSIMPPSSYFLPHQCKSRNILYKDIKLKTYIDVRSKISKRKYDNVKIDM